MSEVSIVGIPAGELAAFKEQLNRIERMISEPKKTPAIMVREQAMQYVHKTSTSAFDRWCKKWGVKPTSHGRYSRDRIDLGLAREAGVVRVPASLRRAQA